jgi:Ribosomal proteins 50S-L18Ae/60S-L20/60S-L18A
MMLLFTVICCLQMYTEMASRHRVRNHQIHIIKTTVIKAADCKRENIIQFHDSKIKFPVTRKCAHLPLQFTARFLRAPSGFLSISSRC